MNLGPHATFIWLSYASVGIAIVALIGWLVANGRQHRAALQDLEARGVRRRSGGSPEAPV